MQLTRNKRVDWRGGVKVSITYYFKGDKQMTLCYKAPAYIGFAIWRKGLNGEVIGPVRRSARPGDRLRGV